MRKPLEITIPTEGELEALETLYQTTREVRLRTRAQMVLLAAEQHLTAPAIAKIVREDDQTVRNWLKRWSAEGIEGLRDRPNPRAPPKVTTGYKEQLLAAVRRRPRSLGLPYSKWTLQRLADYMAEQMGIRVSAKTVHKLLKKWGDCAEPPPAQNYQSRSRVPGKRRRLKRDVPA